MPRYDITDELLVKIAHIETMRAQIGASRILPEREVGMRYRAMVEATHSSTSIEGNPLTGKQVERVLAGAEGEMLTRHGYAEAEVRNYRNALGYIERRKTTNGALSADDVLAVHGIITKGLLPPEKSGAWRTNPVYIENQDGDTVYAAPSAKAAPGEVEALLAWLGGAKGVHPVIAAAVLHIHFVSIHPFADGNGRTARALTMLFLGLAGYDFRGSIVLDSFYAADRQAYYGALRASQGKNYKAALASSLNPWMEYFVDGFLSSAKVLLATVLILASAAGDAGIARRIRQDDADLLGYARQFGSISLDEAEGVLAGVNRRTVQRRLKGLVDGGYLVQAGSARGTRYLWNGGE